MANTIGGLIIDKIKYVDHNSWDLLPMYLIKDHLGHFRDMLKPLQIKRVPFPNPIRQSIFRLPIDNL